MLTSKKGLELIPREGVEAGVAGLAPLVAATSEQFGWEAELFRGSRTRGPSGRPCSPSFHTVLVKSQFTLRGFLTLHNAQKLK